MAIWRIKLLAPAALLALAIPNTARAEPFPINEFTKSTAILGSQSRLAAILAQQGEFARPSSSRVIGWAPGQRFTQSPSVPPVSSPAPFSGRPDVFGTVALKIRQSPLDNKWRRVLQARLSGRPAVFAGVLRGSNEWHRLEAINRYVNSRVRFAEDSRRFGRMDVWTSANDTLDRGQGDCEDYAIAKLQMLRAAGFSDRNLFLVILKDLVRRSDHAVVVVQTGGRMFVLDNGTNRVLENDAVTDYRPILSFAASGVWTHGYKVAPSMKIAGAAPLPIPAAPPATM